AAATVNTTIEATNGTTGVNISDSDSDQSPEEPLANEMVVSIGGTTGANPPLSYSMEIEHTVGNLSSVAKPGADSPRLMAAFIRDDQLFCPNCFILVFRTDKIISYCVVKN